MHAKLQLDTQTYVHYAKQGYANEAEASGAVAGTVGSRLIQGNVCSC